MDAKQKVGATASLAAGIAACVEAILAQMSLAGKIGQLTPMGATDFTPAPTRWRRCMGRLRGCARRASRPTGA